MPQTTEAFSSVTLQPITSPRSLSSPMHVFLLSTLIISHVRPSFWTVTNFMGYRSFIVVLFFLFENHWDPYLPPGFKLFTCRQSNWIHVFIYKLLIDPMKDESHASIHLNIAFQKRRNAVRSFFLSFFFFHVWVWESCWRWWCFGFIIHYFRFMNAVLISFCF